MIGPIINFVYILGNQLFCLLSFLGFVIPHLDAKDFADANGNLGFIINMKKLQPVLVDDETEENSKNESQPSSKRIRLDNN